MNVHLRKNEILLLICKRFDIQYDETRDDNGRIISIIIKDKDTFVTWDSPGFEVLAGKES